tara:strand:- start:21962 stop:22423 length:462 start_codon:yes stop_codon:yes gene_type:complete
MNWYVLHTKPRNEKKVEKQLLSIGINAYCPKKTEIKFWSDRKKKIEVPVLPSMVLVKLNDNDINRVFESPGVIRYMFWLGKRAIIKQSEIDILKKYLNSNCNFTDSKISEMNIGDNLNLSNFNNERGTVSRISNNNIWIYLKSIGYNVKLKLA